MLTTLDGPAVVDARARYWSKIAILAPVIGSPSEYRHNVWYGKSIIVWLAVLSRLDYCNAVLTGLPSSTLTPLQRVLHAAARVVMDLRPRDHVSPALRNLQWLPIKQRIEFRLCLLVHKSFIGHSPAYISDLLTSAADVPGRPALRTASRGDFIVPRTNRKFGDTAFCVAAPRVWNRLPADLRQLRSTQTFRRHLKT